MAGKVALVTGGSRGIGVMIASGLVSAGAKVYVASRKQQDCDRAAAELSELGTCIALPGDLSSHAGTRALAEALAAREPALHVLVNNAGANWGAPLAEYPEAGWDKVMALNVKAVFDLTRLLLPQLEKGSRPGDPARVINVGSIDGLQVPLLETYAYSTSKAAVHHLTRVLARKLAPQITVNAIAPGPFEIEDDGRDAQELRRRDREELPAGPHRRGQRHGRRRDLPRVEGGRLRDGRGDPGGRRDLDDEVAAAFAATRREARRKSRGVIRERQLLAVLEHRLRPCHPRCGCSCTSSPERAAGSRDGSPSHRAGSAPRS